MGHIADGHKATCQRMSGATEHADVMPLAVQHEVERERGELLAPQTKIEPLADRGLREPRLNGVHVVAIRLAQPAGTGCRRADGAGGVAPRALTGCMCVHPLARETSAFMPGWDSAACAASDAFVPFPDSLSFVKGTVEYP